MNQTSARAEHHPTSPGRPFPHKQICLTGFMGSGKTTIGKHLATATGAEFIDLDEQVERQSGRSVAEIFQTDGEAAFREAERRTLETLLTASRAQVIALGGGTFMQPAVEKLLRRRGIPTVFLDAPAEELYRRCVDCLGAPPRPLLKDLPSFKKLYDERLPFYAKAEWRVSTAGATPAQVAAHIESLLTQKAGGVSRKEEP